MNYLNSVKTGQIKVGGTGFGVAILNPGNGLSAHVDATPSRVQKGRAIRDFGR
jgi:hypothetical protein